ncbi:MAG TPA: YcnI family protein [Burkholderiales bacterium]|nr:YcnI family protein [Burkholderiales bacterium]
MQFKLHAPLWGGVFSAFLSPMAFAHVTLDGGEAPSGSYYKATFTVPHGCEGSPTVKIRVRIPDGVTSVKPQGRAGWKLATVKSKLATPIDNGHGGKITEGVTEVSWSGGPLPDDQFEEFKIQMKLPDAPDTTLYFPVVQECAKGATRWIEVPEPGKSSHDLRAPAPALKLRAK